MGKFNWKSMLGGTAAGALGNFIPAVQPYSALLSAGAGAALDKKNRLSGALQGFLGGGLGSAGTNWLRSGMSSGSFGSSMNNYISSIPGFGGFGSASPTGVFSKFFGTKISPTGQVQNAPTTKAPSSQIPGAVNTSSTPPMTSINAPATSIPSQVSGSLPVTGAVENNSLLKKKGMFDDFLPKLKEQVPGALVSMAGNLFAPKVETPDFSSLPGVQAWQRAGSTGIANPEVYGLGIGQLKNFLNTDATVGEDVQNALLHQRDQDYQKLREQRIRDWKMSNPGAALEGNSAFAKDMADFDMRNVQDRDALRTANQYQFSNLAGNQKLASMQAALNLNNQQMEQLAQLAQLDIYQIMMQTGITMEEASQIKQLFANIGEGMLKGGTTV